MFLRGKGEKLRGEGVFWGEGFLDFSAFRNFEFSSFRFFEFSSFRVPGGTLGWNLVKKGENLVMGRKKKRPTGDCGAFDYCVTI